MTVNLNDPRDPWAWRNPWSGEARADYAELWVIVPIIICLSLIAMIIIVPVAVHKYCRRCCPCSGLWLCLDRFLATCSDLDDPCNESDVESRLGRSAAWNSDHYHRNQHTLKPPPLNYFLNQNRRSQSVSHEMPQSQSAPEAFRSESDILRQWNESMNSINCAKNEKVHFIVPKIKFDKV